LATGVNTTYGVGVTGAGVGDTTVNGGDDFFEVGGAEETVWLLGETDVGGAVGGADVGGADVGGAVGGADVGGAVGGADVGGAVGGADVGGAVGGDYVGVAEGETVLTGTGTGTPGASLGADGEQHGAWIFWIAKVKLFIKAISWDSLLSMSCKI